MNNSLSSFIKSVDRLIEVTCIVVIVLTISLMLLTLLAEVVVRYVTNQGMGWPTEVPNLFFPWLVMSGILLAAQRGKHIAINILIDKLGKMANRLLLISLQVLVAGTFLYLAWVGLFVIEITGSEVYPVTGISAKWAYLSIIVGFAGLGITALTTIVRLLQSNDPLTVRSQHLQDEL